MSIPSRFKHLQGSKWTSATPLKGWRQFHVVSFKRGARGWEVELGASVEPATRVWVSATVLADQTRFSPGWATLTEIKATAEVAIPAPATAAPASAGQSRS